MNLKPMIQFIAYGAIFNTYDGYYLVRSKHLTPWPVPIHVNIYLRCICNSIAEALVKEIAFDEFIIRIMFAKPLHPELKMTIQFLVKKVGKKTSHIIHRLNHV